ncbi:MAG TPA: DciA family protein [Gammaproteobacteria bacterium]
MKTGQLFSVHDALTRAGSRLGNLNAAAEKIRFYDRLLDSVLNQPLRSHVTVANLRDGLLVLQADSPVWASRARLLLPDIQNALERGASGPPLTGIHLVTRPRPSVPPAPAPRRAEISDTTRRLLNAVAEDSDNAGLRRALQRIARRTP